MIDIHCHILPAFDDGSPDIETSMEMLRMAASDGITHVAATPHYSYGGSPTAGDIESSMARLRDRAAADAVPVSLLSGADIHLTFELLRGFQQGDIPSINGSRYFLLELPDLIPPNMSSFILKADSCGYVPVITHPERNYSFLTSEKKIRDIREAGGLFQITAMSLTGEFGPEARKLSSMMVKKGLADFVATDAHNAHQRVPLLSKAYREVERLTDAKTAQKLFLDNPRAVVEDLEIDIP